MGSCWCWWLYARVVPFTEFHNVESVSHLHAKQYVCCHAQWQHWSQSTLHHSLRVVISLPIRSLSRGWTMILTTIRKVILAMIRNTIPRSRTIPCWFNLSCQSAQYLWLPGLASPALPCHWQKKNPERARLLLISNWVKRQSAAVHLTRVFHNRNECWRLRCDGKTK